LLPDCNPHLHSAGNKAQTGRVRRPRCIFLERTE
jgi:hypothetical protein